MRPGSSTATSSGDFFVFVEPHISIFCSERKSCTYWFNRPTDHHIQRSTINAKIETPQSLQDPWGAVYWKAQISDGKKEQNISTSKLTNISMWRESTPTLGRSLSLRETQPSGLSEFYFEFWKLFVNGHFGSNFSQDGQEGDKTGEEGGSLFQTAMIIITK